MRRTDVLLAAGSYFPREGGAERQMRMVLEDFAERGLSTTVVTQALLGQSRNDVVGRTCVRRTGSLRALELFPKVGQLSFFVGVFYWTLRLRPRVIVTLQIGSATAAAALANRLLRRPHLVRLTGGGTAQHRSEPLARAASPVGRLVVQILRPRVTTVVAPANHLLADFRDAFAGTDLRTRTIPNGVSLSCEPRVGWESRDGVVWYSRSGTETSSEQFFEIARSAPDIRFTVMGRRYAEQPLPNVEFIGWQSDPESVLKRSKILLNTSPSEGMPNMALQALAAGCWVVGPPSQGLLELQGHYPHAVYCLSVEDPNVVAERLHELLGVEQKTPVALPTYSDVAKDWEALFGWKERVGSGL